MKYRFASQAGEETFVRAVEALRATPRGDLAYAEAFYEKTKEDFQTLYDLKESPSGHACVARLLGKKCSYGMKFPCTPPDGDHCTMWILSGKPILFVSQPYDFHVVENARFCEQYGLDVRVSLWPAWHYPGRVFYVEYTTKQGRALLDERRKDLHVVRRKKGSC